MCNCIEVQGKKILEHLIQKYPDRKYDEELNGFDGTGFKNQAVTIVDGGSAFFEVLYQDFAVTYTFKKVNGEQSSPKKQTISVNPAFCIFCGVKF